MASHYDTILAAVRLAAWLADEMGEGLINWDEHPELKFGDRHVLLRVVSEVDEDSRPVKTTTLVDGQLVTCLGRRSLVAVDVRVETVRAREMPHLVFANRLKAALWANDVLELLRTSDPPAVLMGEAGQLFNRSADKAGTMLPQSSFEVRFRAQTVDFTDPTPVGIINTIVAEGSTDDGNPTPYTSTVTATRP